MFDIIPKGPGFSKETAHALIISAIVVLVGVGAFGLGRLTALQDSRQKLVIHAPDMPAALAEAVPLDASSSAATLVHTGPVAHNFVASKNGTKYYPASCAGAARIKESNQVWFATEADAKGAGYSLSASCK